MTTKEPNFKDLFTKAIYDAVELEVSKEFDKKIKELTKQKDNIVSGIVLNISEHVSYQYVGRELVITIKKDLKN